MNSRGEREDPDRIMRWQKAQVVAVEGGGVGATGAGDMEEEAEVEMPVTELPRIGTKLRGAIITGSEVMTRRWRGQAPHLHSEIIHWYAVELERRREVISFDGLNKYSEPLGSRIYKNISLISL